MENNTISVILPIKSGKTGFFEEYFEKCITSVKEQKTPIDELIIVHTDEKFLTNHLNSFDFGDINVKFEVWTKEPNFASQVNHGVKVATSKWVSILEFDDEISNIWIKNFKKYAEVYPKVDAFLPIVVDVDEKGVFVGFTNEATFAANFSEEMGILNNETLLTYQNFQISGMAIKKESYVDYGMMKSTFKLTFGYEFLLRMTHNSVRFMTIPKIGYKHTNLREGSIFWNYKNGDDRLSEDEVRFWIDNAKKEYVLYQSKRNKIRTTRSLMTNDHIETDPNEVKKKGRKPKVNNYFDEREENAVRMYLTATTFEEKNKIYNDFLRHPLDKMISSIIRRYKLYRKDMNFDEVHIDTHSFLMTKIDKFKPSKEKKAYSYFGTICKNYLMGQIMKDQKDMNRKISYEDISSDLQHSPDMIYYIDNDGITTEEIIKKFLMKLSDTMSDKQITEQEIKLGQALYDMFDNYNNIFLDTSNNKFNKNVILFELREMTNLTTKEIRSSIKRYKKIYYQLIQEMLK